MTTTSQVINAGQKTTLSLTNLMDGAGNPVASLPAGAKVSYSANNPNYLQIAANADGVTAVAEALTPPAQGFSITVSTVLAFTDPYGLVHAIPGTMPFTIDFAPGVITGYTIGATPPQ
jgi:hypothetical protein